MAGCMKKKTSMYIPQRHETVQQRKHVETKVICLRSDVWYYSRVKQHTFTHSSSSLLTNNGTCMLKMD